MTGTSDERGVSTVLGATIVLGVVLTALGLLFVGLGQQAGDTADRISTQGAEENLRQLSTEVDAVTVDGTARSRSVGMGLDNANGDGQTLVRNTTGRLVVNVSTGADEEVNRSLGAVEYRADGVRVAYQGGGIWKDREGEPATAVEGTTLSYTEGASPTLSIPVVSVDGTDSLSDTATVQRVCEQNEYRPTFVGAGETVDIAVTTAYAGAWERHLREQLPDGPNADISRTGDTVRAEYTAPGQGMYLRMSSYEVHVGERGSTAPQACTYNSEPSVNLDVRPANPVGGDDLTLDASESFDTDGRIGTSGLAGVGGAGQTAYHWDLDADDVYELSTDDPVLAHDDPALTNLVGTGDGIDLPAGATTTGPNPLKDVDDAGYNFTVAVTDDDRANGTATASVEVANAPPSIDSLSLVSGNSTAPEGVDEVVDAEASDPDDPESVLDYTFEVTSGVGEATFGGTDSTTTDDNTTTLSVLDGDATVTVAVTATDDDGDTDSETLTLAVDNVEPTVDVGVTGPTPVPAGSTQSYYVNASDPGDDTISYTWSGGTFASPTGTVGVDGQTIGFSGAPSALGKTTDVSVEVSDGDGSGPPDASDSMSVLINAPPTADVADSTKTVYQSDTVSFDGSGSNDANDPSDVITDWAWDFGDGNTTSGSALETPSHGFYLPNSEQSTTYTTELTVTDDEGATDADTVSVTVEDRAPSASFTPTSASTNVGSSVSFDAAGSSDPDGEGLTYDWDFGDGTTATGQSVSHAYGSAGTYTVTLTTTDPHGKTDTATGTVTVNAGPTASFTLSPDPANVGETVSVDASGSSDPDGSIASYAWDFGDGTTAAGKNAGHAYGSSGTYTITLTVTDDDGLTDTAARTVEVNAPPNADVSLISIDGDTQEIDASGSGDPNGDTLEYKYDFYGDGSWDTGYTSDSTYVFEQNPPSGPPRLRMTNARVKVRDAHGATDTASTSNTNSDPVADFDYSGTPVYQGESVTLDATADGNGDGQGSYDPDGSIGSYTWSGPVSGSGDAASLDTSTPGDKDVTLTVEDDASPTGTDSITRTATVQNRAPSASYSSSTTMVEKCVSGDCSKVTDWARVTYYEVTDTSTDPSPGESANDRTWTVTETNDGTTSTYVGASVNLTTSIDYYDPTKSDVNNDYEVELTVEDEHGATDTVSGPSSAPGYNLRPQADFTASTTTTTAGTSVSFDANGDSNGDGEGSFDPDGPDSGMTYDWDFGDGATASGETASHSWSSPGTYTVELTVGDGGKADTHTATVDVNAPSVTASILPVYGCSLGGPSQDITLSGGGSPNGGTYNWYEGSTASGSPDRTGQSIDLVDVGSSYSQTWTLEYDHPSGTDTKTQFVTASSSLGCGGGGGSNQQPVADWTVVSQNDQPGKGTWTLDGTASYDPDSGDSIASYEWCADGLCYGSGETFSFNIVDSTDDGTPVTKTVELRVTSTDGTTSSISNTFSWSCSGGGGASYCVTTAPGGGGSGGGGSGGGGGGGGGGGTGPGGGIGFTP